MNKIVGIFEAGGFTQKDYDDIMEGLQKTGGANHPNRLSHVSFPKGNNWCVIDVWDSPEAFMQFAQQRLVPIFTKLGLTPLEPQIFPVHNFIGAGKEAMAAH